MAFRDCILSARDQGALTADETPVPEQRSADHFGRLTSLARSNEALKIFCPSVAPGWSCGISLVCIDTSIARIPKGVC